MRDKYSLYKINVDLIKIYITYTILMRDTNLLYKINVDRNIVGSSNTYMHLGMKGDNNS